MAGDWQEERTKGRMEDQYRKPKGSGPRRHDLIDYRTGQGRVFAAPLKATIVSAMAERVASSMALISVGPQDIWTPSFLTSTSFHC